MERQWKKQTEEAENSAGRRLGVLSGWKKLASHRSSRPIISGERRETLSMVSPETSGSREPV